MGVRAYTLKLTYDPFTDGRTPLIETEMDGTRSYSDGTLYDVDNE